MKTKIVIASTLKSIYDVRSYHKFAQSLGKTNKYEINIIGNQEKSRNILSKVKLYPHSIRRNQWLKRLFLKWNILFKILKIKPNYLIITTHELLTITPFIKLFSRCKITYDIQENYYFNILHLSKYPLKKFIAKSVRFKEIVFSKFIHHFTLAEKCYQDELNFIDDKYTILENKAYDVSLKKSENQSLKLLFSGTISEYSGINESITIYRKLKSFTPDISLTIIGQIHSQKIYNNLHQLASQKENHITLKIAFDPIPHNEIIDEIFKSDIGIIAYQENTVNKNKVPTKLYEYSRYRLSYIVAQNTTWSKRGEELGGAIPLNFEEWNAESFLSKYEKSKKSFLKPYPETKKWEQESHKLINLFND